METKELLRAYAAASRSGEEDGRNIILENLKTLAAKDGANGQADFVV